MEVEWDTRQKEFRSWAKAADTTAARDRDERAPRGPSSVPNGQDASVHVHPDTLILPASYLLPLLWFKTKTHKNVQTADCTVLGILCFRFLPPAAPFLPMPFVKGVGRRL